MSEIKRGRGRPPGAKNKKTELLAKSAAQPDPSPSIDSEDSDQLALIKDLGVGNDKFVAALDEIVERIIEKAKGVRVLCKVKKYKLLRGEGEWEVDSEDGTVYVYTTPPDTKLLQFVVEQARGKAGTKESAVKASTLVLKLAVPGHDPEIDEYLKSLPEDVLSKFDFDHQTLKRISS